MTLETLKFNHTKSNLKAIMELQYYVYLLNPNQNSLMVVDGNLCDGKSRPVSRMNVHLI